MKCPHCKKEISLSCKRCGATWTPRQEEPPTTCPKCRSPYWNKEKVK